MSTRNAMLEGGMDRGRKTSGACWSAGVAHFRAPGLKRPHIKSQGGPSAKEVVFVSTSSLSRLARAHAHPHTHEHLYAPLRASQLVPASGRCRVLTS